MKITIEKLKKIIKEELEKEILEGDKHLPPEAQEKRANLKRQIKDLIKELLPDLRDPNLDLTRDFVEKQAILADMLQNWTALDKKQRREYPGHFGGKEPKSISDEFGVMLPDPDDFRDLKTQHGIFETKKNHSQNTKQK